MNEFIEKLKRLTHDEPSSLGFRREQSARPGRKIQLVTSLSPENVGDIAGADAALVSVPEQGIDSESLKKMPEDIPWGGWLKGGRKEIKQLTEAGCDFVVFAADMPLEIIEDSGAGKILEIEPSISDGLLGAVNELPVDAVLVSDKTGKGDSLTWQDLMLFQRFAGILNKPLLACVPAKVTRSELEALWEAGVNAVVVDTKIKGSVSKIRKEIDKAEFASTRQREKVEPVLHPKENQ